MSTPYIDPSDVKEEHPETTPSAVRLTHVPTGTVVEVSRLPKRERNRSIAVDMLEEGLRRLGWNDDNFESDAQAAEKGLIPVYEVIPNQAGEFDSIFVEAKSSTDLENEVTSQMERQMLDHPWTASGVKVQCRWVTKDEREALFGT